MDEIKVFISNRDARNKVQADIEEVLHRWESA